jgi:hypothetical protein
MLGEPETSGRAIPAYTHDLAISAVPYDAMFVAELVAALSPRLRTSVVWAGNAESAGSSALLDDSSRVVLVLHQRLWRLDGMTQSDDTVLRERLRQRPESIRVVTLDDAPVPDWLGAVQRCDLTEVGLGGVAAFVLEAVVASGGSLRQAQPDAAPDADVKHRWPHAPAPFLAQPRAHSVLRRQIDAVAAELAVRIEAEEGVDTERVVELHSLPNRLVARLGDVGVSFSWVAGRSGTVADGRLLVIQWGGLAGRGRGINALKAGTLVRERTYHVEGTDSDSWRWRADDPNGRACSTANLVAEWLAGASMASVGIAPEPESI